MSRREAAIALTRFGFGARPGDLDEVSHDPRGWLLAQLESSDLPEELEALPSTSDTAEVLREMRDQDDRSEMQKAARRHTASEVVARTRAMANSEGPFRERWVAHWSNHFTVGRKNRLTAAIGGAYEREAIRPHASTSFATLLRAVARHPAMLIYLDQATSIGPDSKAGQRRDRGLNENFARELLELHTMGVDGGYEQEDVRELARLLTGWSVDRQTGDFTFRRAAHDPGDKHILGKVYGTGQGSGERVLKDLAAHPSTARYVATRLARHFVADSPAEASVDALAEAFERSGGDLVETATALIDLEEAWVEGTKVKTPWDLVVHVLRLLPDTEDRQILASLRAFDQVPFAAPSPEGWSDRALDWVGGEALLRRIEWCEAAAGKFDGDALELADAVLGPLLSQQTRRAMRRSSTPHAVFLASPDFQRR